MPQPYETARTPDRRPAPAPTRARPPDPRALTPAQARVLALQRTAGNRAVTAALGGASVQRWAWVAGTQIARGDALHNAATRRLARDHRVHDYVSWQEYRDHAAGTTDHIGNLPGPTERGVWVRFPAGTNILGENHTEVSLPQVVRAVGSTSFTYEPFSTDHLAAGSRMRAAYRAENRPLLRRMGGDPQHMRRYGGESLYPKIGVAMSILDRRLGAGQINVLRSGPGRYVGQPVQRYLKIGWAMARDITADVDARVAAGRPVSAERAALAAVVRQHRGLLNGYIRGLARDGYLGDTLRRPWNRRRIAPLQAFAQAIVPALLARIAGDNTLTQQERAGLANMPAGSNAQREAVFADWRNLHFEHAVAAAAGRGVRYIGMGLNHLHHLQNNNAVPGGAHTHDMTGAAIVAFRTNTNNLAGGAQNI